MSSQTYWETLIQSQLDGAAITAAAATSLLPAQAKKTLGPNFFDHIGQKLLIKASGKISSVITTPGTARFDVRFGSTVIFDGLAVLLDTAAAAASIPWDLEIRLTCRVVGAAASLYGIGRFTAYNLLGTPATPPKGALTAMLPWNTTPGTGNTFDSTASQAVDLFFTQTVATGSITCSEYELTSQN